MPVEADSQVGPYTILGRLGAGGMGEVWRASDPRLGREVAIKILPQGFCADAERLRRFEKEARAAGGLNHPNILAVFDVGTHEGAPYFVCELLEGETLRERLEKGALPVRKALEAAIEIARGLAAAHEKGIVHRDLKPENLFFTRDGHLKVLDFGLARNTGEEPGPDATASEAVVGTAGYMAPEQVRGRVADERSDIFSFGAVLYEMLVGQRAFPGESAVERGHAILSKEPPDLDTAGPIAPSLGRIVRRCLEKAPEQRFQSARDLGFALEALAETPSQPSARPQARPRRPAFAIALVAVGLVVAAATALLVGGRTGPASALGVRYTRLTFQRLHIGEARFAPDGTSVIFSASVEKTVPQVFTVTPGNPDMRALSAPATCFRGISKSGEMALLVLSTSDDSSQPWTLALAPLAGGAPRQVAENALNADFGPDDALLALRVVKGRTRLEYPLGKVLEDTEGSISSPRVSPDGKSVAFASNKIRDDERAMLTVIGADGARRVLGEPWHTINGLAWAPAGDEIWIAASRECGKYALWAVSMSGKERKLLEMSSATTLLDVARDGRVLVERLDSRLRMSGRGPGSQAERDLSWFDGSKPASISADGRFVLFTEEGEAACGPRKGAQAFLRRTDGSPAVRISQGRAGALSPDAKWALVAPAPPYNTLQLVPTGPGQPRALNTTPLAAIYAAVFFPDGKRILLGGHEEGHLLRAWVVDTDGGPPRPLWKEGVVSGVGPSPDGRYAAVATDVDGHTVLIPADGAPTEPLADLPAHQMPIAWSPDAKALVVKLETEERGPTHLGLFDLASRTLKPWRDFDAPDGDGSLNQILLSADNESYVLGYSQSLSDLYLIEGLRWARRSPWR